MTGARWGGIRRLASRPWSASQRLLARTPLRVKLIVAVLLLVTVALGLISVASIASLRGYLVSRLDNQLQLVASRPAPNPLQNGGGSGNGGGGEGQNNQRSQPPSPYWVQFLDADGNVRRDSSGNVMVFSNPLLQGQQPPKLRYDAAWLRAHAGGPFTLAATSGASHWRVLVQFHLDGTSTVAAASLDDISGTITRLQRIDLIVSAVVLVVLAGIVVMIVRANLRPLVEIEQVAGAIAEGELTRRVPDRDPRTEVGQLGRALNAMLAQIEAAFGARAASEVAARRSEERMRRFVSDASHELRTPLTTIRGFAELYRQGAAREPAELDRLMRRIEDQAASMGLLVNDLLLLARLDQQRPLERHPVDLLTLVADAVQDARAVAPDRQVALLLGDGDAPGEPLIVLGDESRLRQVIANLMSNALTHTPPSTSVEVRARTDAQHAVVEVADHGPGLTPEQTERVFERFYRADPARSHAQAGTSGTDGGAGAGLGLAIVAALVAAHSGTVEVDSTPGRGATFKLLLPLAPDTAEAPA
ncbi:MAG TPA: HAMP domain-containing sensor histidine kinase [Actinomycetota bacterium]